MTTGQRTDFHNISQRITPFNDKLSHFLESSFFLRYGFSMLILAVVVALKFVMLPPFDTPYLFVLTAIIITALYAGIYPSIFITFLSLLTANFFFIAPQFALKFNQNTALHGILYILQGLLISFLIERERKVRKLDFEHSEKLRVTLASIGDAVISTDVAGKITFMNKIAEDLTGWTNHGAIGESCERVFTIFSEKTKRKARCPVAKALKERKVVGLANNTMLLRRDGSRIPVDDSAAPIKDTDGQVIGVVLIFRDVTQKRILEQKKDDFISVASHELKTPVTSIKLFVQLLKRKSEQNGYGEFTSIVEKIDSQLNKLIDLVNDFLDSTRIQVGRLIFRREVSSLDDLVEEAVSDLRKIYNDFDIVLEGKVNKKILIDNERIKQVLINLVNNSVKFSNGNKKIIVSLGKSKGNALVKVRDFGIGIPKKLQNKIFDRYYQIQPKGGGTSQGLGLGLYLSSEIIKGHNGKIWVESEEGKGSIFIFQIPFGKK